MENKFTKPNIDLKGFEDFKVKVSQVPPLDVAFQTMALSEYELLVATIYKLNQLITTTNSYTELINEILVWVVNEGLEHEVVEQLNVWLNDGTLETLINDALFNSKLDKTEFTDFKNNTYQVFINDVYNAFVTSNNQRITIIEEDLALKENTIDVDQKLAFKADKTTVNESLILKANKTYVDDNLKLKADKNELIMRTTAVETLSYAHRGLSGGAPENSIPAFIKAGKRGVAGIETDLVVTSEGGIFVMHDTTVDRTTDGSGSVADKTNAQMRALRLNHGVNVHKYKQDDLVVPELYHVVNIAKDYGMKLLLELKGGWSSAMVTKLINYLKRKGVYYDTTIASFGDDRLNTVRSIDQNIKIQRLFDRTFTVDDIQPTIDFGLPIQVSLNYRNNQNEVSSVTMDTLHENGVEVGFWTVNDSSVLQALKIKGAQFIVSDMGYGGVLKNTKRQGNLWFTKDDVGAWKERQTEFIYQDDVDVVFTYQTIQVRYKVPFEIPSTAPVLVSWSFSGENQTKIKLIARAQDKNGFDINILNEETGTVMTMASFRSAMTGTIYFNFVAEGFN